NAVPHFDMKPGQRLTPLREVGMDARTLVGASTLPEIAARAPTDKPILEVSDITKAYTIRKSGWFGSTEAAVKAVDGVSFEIKRGECFGLVGESGCGKTTVSKMIMRAVTPDTGRILYRDGGREVDIHQAPQAELDKLRTRIQMVFQDPFSALNPRMTVSNILTEPLEV
ncbi:MAG: ATP-binding cassette domain-containing protein, partial [Rhodobacteraceae bacterium]|nr:ATP-binding cassette domain-containing protein [Paracoccaceae bacterium]